MVTRSASDSRQGSSLEWCSYGPTNTTGRRAGSAARGPPGTRPSTRTSRSTAPVTPVPQKTTTSPSPALTDRWIVRRACSRSAVVRRPVAVASVCVFAYVGSTRWRMKSSTNDRARPDAV